MMTEVVLSLALFAGDFAALDAPSWTTREAATKRLEAAGLAAVPGAEWLRDTSPSAEVRSRCRQLVGPDRYPLSEDHADVFPWLCDPKRDYFSQDVWMYILMRQIEAESGLCRTPKDGYLVDRIAAVRWARLQLAAGVPRAEIHRQLDVMRRLEAKCD